MKNKIKEIKDKKYRNNKEKQERKIGKEEKKGL